MAKVQKILLPRKSTPSVKAKFLFFYTEKFFNKWMSKYKFEGLTYQQQYYLMKKLWCEGSVACSSVKRADKELAGLIDAGKLDMGENELIFTPWAPDKRFNIYDFPTHVRLINTRGVKFITEDSLKLDEEVVIIYAQKNHKSVYSSIEAKLLELIDIEMKMRSSRKAQSQGWLFTFDPEDREQAKIMQEALDLDEPYIFVPLGQPDKCKGINNGAPYILDKLEQDRQKVENDILTILGVNNVGVGEKKEHLIVDEVNANNQDIEESDNIFQNQLEDDFKRVNSCFGKTIKVIDMNEMYTDEDLGYNEDEEEDEEDAR